MPQLCLAWGQVLEVWEGYARDKDIRYMGSSGGVATALALYCIEKRGISGVLHTGVDSACALKNTAVFSVKRDDLMACTGSRYSPAGPCAKLSWMENSSGPSVFIGKPCDVVALRKSQAVSSGLMGKADLAISIFCAGTPATLGTLKMLEELGVSEEDVREIRYRGCGWPGQFVVKTRRDNKICQMSYEESWGRILSKYAQFRCRLCPDSTGELADISCGDPWYRRPANGEPGRSLILVRTRKGKAVLEGAVAAGYVECERVAGDTLPRSQEALLRRRRHLFGRLAAMRMMGVPTPHYFGFSLFANWRRLNFVEKIRSVAGTLRRGISRGWTRPDRSFIKETKAEQAIGSDCGRFGRCKM
jgi:coenzyme F420 hydrogenase subunit beta